MHAQPGDRIVGDVDERALELTAVDPLDLPCVAVPPLPKRPTGADVVRAAVARSVRELFAHVPLARQGTDPEGVHQARVATRRMRSDLRTFEPLVDKNWAHQLRAELRWLAAELGRVRDADVLGEHLSAVLATHAEIDSRAGHEILALLARQRDRDHLDLVGHLADGGASALFGHLMAAADRPCLRRRSNRPARDVLPPLVASSWVELRAGVDRLGADPPDAALHEVRILAKRARYAAEAVAPALGKEAERFARAATSIQNTLGDLHDAAVAADWLEHTAAPRLSIGAVFAAGRLAQQLHTDAILDRTTWQRAFEKMQRHSAWLAGQRAGKR
jgi:CHAD domain-containing protein